jgi:DNA-binding PadR family transcriptional regulator
VTTTTRGFREPSYFVLASLLDGPRHGYGIIKQAALLSGGDVRLAPGTLYGALDRLAAAGLIESSGQEVVAGRPRHYYRLTDVGRNSLLEEARRLATAASAVLDMPEGTAEPAGPVVDLVAAEAEAVGRATGAEADLRASGHVDHRVSADAVSNVSAIQPSPSPPPSPSSSVLFNGVASQRA